MTWKNFCLSLDPVCLKKERTVNEFDKIRKTCQLVNCCDLYSLIDDMSYQEFYQELKEVLYYDKYECVHGTEFMYYVKMEGLPQSVTPTDIINIMRIGGLKDVY